MAGPESWLSTQGCLRSSLGFQCIGLRPKALGGSNPYHSLAMGADGEMDQVTRGDLSHPHCWLF